MAFVYRELLILSICVLVFAFGADNDTTSAPSEATTVASSTATTAGTTAATPVATTIAPATTTAATMTDLASFVTKLPFSLWSICKYGADTMKDIAASVFKPFKG